MKGPALLAAGLAGLCPLAAAGAATSYDNTVHASTEFYGSQAGAEAIDDLHALYPGILAGVTFEYRDPGTTGETFQATLTVYANPGGLDQSLTPVYGPVTVPDLTEGQHTVSLPVADGPSIGRDLWIGVRFTSPSAGLVINNSPTIGSSHDLYLEAGQLFWFGGNPKANFSLRVNVNGSTSAVPDLPVAGLDAGTLHPNPVTARTPATISYSLAQEGTVRIFAFDPLGRRIATVLDEDRAAGPHAETFDTTGWPSGFYFIRIETAGAAKTRKLVITR